MNDLKKLNELIYHLQEANKLSKEMINNNLEEGNDFEICNHKYEVHLYRMPINWRKLVTIDYHSPEYPLKASLNLGHIELYSIGKTYDDLFMEDK